MPAFTLFPTPVGRCAIAWGEAGIVAVQLPEDDEERTRARMQRRFPEAREEPPTREAAAAIEAIGRLLRGEAADLSGLLLDMARTPPFHRRVYEAARAIPAGETATYGEIAAGLGEPGAARAVGQALGDNPFAIVVPCHRVTAADGRLGGFSAHGGRETKIRLLQIEQAFGPPTLFGEGQ